MGKRDRYEPGTFCWVDLQTTDPAGAKSFYGELFGWDAVDMSAGNDATYTMFTLEGDDVAALGDGSSEERERGFSPYWLSYISVEDASAMAAKVDELGGTVFGGAFDVLDAGRMTVVQDPTGAVFAA